MEQRLWHNMLCAKICVPLPCYYFISINDDVLKRKI